MTKQNARGMTVLVQTGREVRAIHRRPDLKTLTLEEDKAELTRVTVLTVRILADFQTFSVRYSVI